MDHAVQPKRMRSLNVKRQNPVVAGSEAKSELKIDIRENSLKTRLKRGDLVTHWSGQGLKRFALMLLDSSRTVVPSRVKRLARKGLRKLNTVQARMRLVAGIRPISEHGGWDRGTPINRYYLEQFLSEFSCDISGHCLEFQSDLYTSRFGRRNVDRLSILDKNASNRAATIVADLTRPNDLPSNTYDCIVCTYVLHLVPEYETLVLELYRILKPGGILLVAVPNISRSFEEDHEMWRFTPEGLQWMMSRIFGAPNVIVRGYGSSLAAAGFVRGLSAEDLTERELNSQHDPHFTVTVCARVCKMERDSADG